MCELSYVDCYDSNSLYRVFYQHYILAVITFDQTPVLLSFVVCSLA